MSPGLGEQDIGGHVIVVVQQHVHFDPALGAAKASPREQRQAQGDGRRVQAQQLVLEAELRLALTDILPAAQAIGQVPEQRLEQGGRTMGVGVGKRRALRRPADADVHQFADATGQAMADLPQRVRPSQMAEQHGHQLRPAREAFRPVLGPVLAYQLIECIARHLPQQLTEQTRLPYHIAEALR